jgi:hypothetical protein
MIERSKDKAVNVTERQSLRGFAPQHVELMSKDKDLSFQRSPRRNTPIKAHQINLQRSLIGSEYQPIRGRGQPF